MHPNSQPASVGGSRSPPWRSSRQNIFVGSQRFDAIEPRCSRRTDEGLPRKRRKQLLGAGHPSVRGVRVALLGPPVAAALQDLLGLEEGRLVHRRGAARTAGCAVAVCSP